MYLLLTPYVKAQQQDLWKSSAPKDQALDGNKKIPELAMRM
jgi:hypothetical protein